MNSFSPFPPIPFHLLKTKSSFIRELVLVESSIGQGLPITLQEDISAFSSHEEEEHDEEGPSVDGDGGGGGG